MRRSFLVGMVMTLHLLVLRAQEAHEVSRVQHLVNMAGLAASQKRYGEAGAKYKEAASLMGSGVSIQLQLRMGDVFMFTGDFEEARGAYQVPFMIDRRQSRISLEDWVAVGTRLALAADFTNQTKLAMSALENIFVAYFTSPDSMDLPLLPFCHLSDLLKSKSADETRGISMNENGARLFSILKKLASEHLLTTRAFQRYDHLRSLSELTREDPRSEELLDCREAETIRYDDIESMSGLMARYSAFHRRSVACCRSRAPRFLIYRPSEVGEGWGNRVLSLSSAFIFAVRTSRVFLVNWTEPSELKELLRRPYDFDWDFSSAVKSCNEKAISSDADKFEIEDVYKESGEVLNNQLSTTLIYSSLHDLYRPIRSLREFDKLRYLCHQELRGLDNVSQPLSKWQLFRCTSSFLFRPSRAIADSLRSELGARMDMLGRGITISAAVRLGSKSTSYYPVLNKAGEENFLRCVRLLLDAHGSRASLALYSDSPELRRAWKARFQRRSWFPNSTVEYSGKQEKFQRSTLSSRRGIMDAVVEWFLIGEADDAVLTSGSTFGQTAWARTMRTKPIEVDNFDRTCYRRFEQEAETVWDRACCSRHSGRCPSSCLLHP